MGRLFGTDGARGVANSELTAELAMNIGRAAAMVLISDEVEHPTILIGKDTRLSGDMLEGALIAGLSSVGANVGLLGVVPTPAVAYLVGKYNADAGIMISASHNPFEFNGIKIFSSDGCKLPDDLENRIEEIVLDNVVPYALAKDENIGKVTRMDDAVEDYIDHVAKSIECDLEGMEIALDCSNGSSSRTAEKLFTKLGAKVHMLFDNPDGININKDCGSTHINRLQNYVREHKLCCGLAFDGDADRCLAVDENGNLVDGDYLIAICAKDMKDRGVLKKNAVVGTVMTNMGFNKFCEANGMTFVSTKVGDRYVLEAMLREGYNIGGEQSGHIIFLDYATTGDGELSGAMILSIMKRTGEKLSALAKVMERMPQVLINVKVSAEGKLAFYTDKEVKAEIKRVTEILGDRGRILVRVSGTEPLVRVMLEGENLEEIQSLAEESAQVVRERLS
ncbi:phosphoglucosamine mutase [Ruminococcus sp.]|uniref:phosphoglucosamine mutase n=1 Tax=Ruminococcus sp. TaxID=41978 RepID=UPI00260CE08E|nr:phosphoglucosamine mutase [Ruminococcus sp.]MDD6989325.1 phosphoglucosamine mutase [Ruminococcus sp.]MDY6202179.1 phosphoglucosamine mutase [Ruminococcus sp.]